MKKTFLFLAIFIAFSNNIFSDIPPAGDTPGNHPAKTFNSDDISKLSSSYVEGKLDFQPILRLPALVLDVGDFEIRRLLSLNGLTLKLDQGFHLFLSEDRSDDADSQPARGGQEETSEGSGLHVGRFESWVFGAGESGNFRKVWPEKNDNSLQERGRAARLHDLFRYFKEIPTVRTLLPPTPAIAIQGVCPARLRPVFHFCKFSRV